MVVKSNRYKVIATYGSSRLVDIVGKTKEMFEKKAREKGLRIESFKVTDFKVELLNHYIDVEVVFVGSPIAPAVIIAILAVVKIGLIALSIWLVGKEVIQPVVEVAKPVAKAVEKGVEELAEAPMGMGVLALVVVIGLIAYAYLKRR